MTQGSSPSTPPRAKRRRLPVGMLLGGLCLLAVCLVIRYYWGAEPANAGPPKPSPTKSSPARSAASKDRSPQAATTPSTPKLKTVASVNGEPITRQELAQECLRHYGQQVLESLVNKHLIMQECQQRKMVITQADVDMEIRQMAQRFGLPVDRWLKMLKEERGIKPAQYASDIIWPSLALRKLAGTQLQVAPEELEREFESRYGAAVKARLIVCRDAKKAQQARAAAVANPEEFGNLAKQYSDDVGSRSLKGMIQPIRKHMGDKEIEKAAFEMKDGEVSQVIPAGGQYVILKREYLFPARKVNREDQKPQLEEIIRDRKMRGVAQQIFRQLQQHSVIENVLNDPVRSREMPGIAAVINGRQISMLELAEHCIHRHGEEVLEGTINRKLLQLACQKQKITITEEDLDREIARAASVMVPPRDGKPDVEAWLKKVTRRQGVSVEIYRRDSVWPSVALKKLVGDSIQITDEDLKKGFEANYGPRVRCRAIVLNNLRIAQQVWEKARKNPTVEYFGQLAEQYSIEASSRALAGEIPPIRQNGGRPLLEKEAFSLGPGELSSIVQLGETYIILLCEGRTKPVNVDAAKVRELIHEDLHEKRLRLAMAEYFRNLRDRATIDNYLAGTTQSPKKGPLRVESVPHTATSGRPLRRR